MRSGDDTPDDIFDRKGASGAELIISSPNDMRGMVATWLYYRYRAGNIAQSIYREALNAAWNHDHHQVRQFVRNNRLQLKSMWSTGWFSGSEGDAKSSQHLAWGRRLVSQCNSAWHLVDY